jgi:probable F420-dependent oxidoreductase
MDFGLFLPVSGRAAGRRTLAEAAQRAERWGYSSVWAADRIVIPWTIETEYRYAEGSEFIVPPDRPFLEPLTVLAYLAGCTERVRLGVSVLVLPYRNPVYWAKIVTTIDTLSEGRFILGVGIGWMREEFAALGAGFEDRAADFEEQMRLLEVLLDQERCTFRGERYTVEDVAFLPKAFNGSLLPVWVGGESKRAQSRAGRLGDAWFPYFVRVTSEELSARFDHVRQVAVEHGRNAEDIELHLCRSIELTEAPVAQEADRLRGSPEQLAGALRAFERAGVGTLALQFSAPRYPERLEQIERFAEEVLPAFR